MQIRNFQSYLRVRVLVLDVRGHRAREGRREMFNSFMGYNDIAHVRELTKEVVWMPGRRGNSKDRELWYRAAKTDLAYQESRDHARPRRPQHEPHS